MRIETSDGINRVDLTRTGQRCTDSVQLSVQFREGFSRNVAEPTRGVQTVSDLRQRSFGDVQEIQTGSAMPPRESFNDVCRHRVGGLPDLAA
jgi:hypothetical protein